nr:PilN domain-containing protein [Hydrogenophilus thiooxidans]
MRRVEPIAVVDALPRLLPEGVALTQLERHDAEVTLRGLARSNGTVSELMRALESSPDFHRVRLIETQATEVDRQSGVRFALVVAIDRDAIEQRTSHTEGTER